MADVTAWDDTMEALTVRVEAAEAEVERLREVAIEGGACWCTWDIGEDGEDYIESPHAECPVHVVPKGEQAR